MNLVIVLYKYLRINIKLHFNVKHLLCPYLNKVSLKYEDTVSRGVIDRVLLDRSKEGKNQSTEIVVIVQLKAHCERYETLEKNEQRIADILRTPEHP